MFNEQKKINQLVSAAQDGDLETVKRLVNKGVPIDAKNENRHSALGLATYYDRTGVAKWLIENGATVMSANINRAVTNNNEELLEFMAAKGVNISSAAKDMAVRGNTKLLGIAVDQGADMKEALEAAALAGQEETVVFLTDKKAEVTEQTVKNARESGNQAVAELLGMLYDPKEAEAWQQKQKVLTEGSVEDIARLKVKEMEEAAQQICGKGDPEKQQRLAKLKNVVSELEKGLDILQQSPKVDFKFTTKLNEADETAVIVTNVQGELVPLRLEVSAETSDTITEYTGDDAGYTLSAYTYSAYYKGVKLVTNEFNSVSDAVNDVIERAFKQNAVQPEASAAAAKKQAPAR